jgi:hypothetical protein
VLVLYVVQLKRLSRRSPLLAVDPGVDSIDFLGTLVLAVGVVGSSTDTILNAGCTLGTAVEV